MGYGISKILKYMSLKVMYYEFKRIQLLRQFKGKELRLGLGTGIENAQIGFRVFIGGNTKLINSSIGHYSYINSCSVIKNTKIGKFCSIGSGVKINLGTHPSNMVSSHPAFYANNKPFETFSDRMYFNEYKEVNIGNDVLIGEEVFILGGVNINDGAIIASRAVVTRDVPPYAIMGGVPAKLIKYRFDEETISQLIRIKWWNKDLEWIKANFLHFHEPNEFLDICGTKE
jgi:acetyltransferase-like isoleucine patch superfamily enzyme